MASSRWKKATTAVRIQNTALKVLSGVPHGIDGDTYFSPSIPRSVKSAVVLLQDTENMTEDKVKSALATVMSALSTCLSPLDSTLTIPALTSLSSTLSLSFFETSSLVTGLTLMVSTAIRNRTKLSVVKRDLAAMQVPPSTISLLTSHLRQSRLELQTSFARNKVRAPSLTSFRWRVDVAISTESLQKVFKPTILCEVNTDDGKSRTFEMPVDQFHHLRYEVAKVLRNMEEIERHPIMRLAFQADMEAFEKGDALE
ncbi:hypothetical protein TrCOL_g3788 [Triparma columacea]|uniref:COMM domain-containing protein 5 n=1 Tax=Triparma columacea TaxID=722753 RepID=A0A9W7L774_9STRA|nr:hypothetical protein TrCOL_g3788 [Triparma columacea]